MAVYQLGQAILSKQAAESAKTDSGKNINGWPSCAYLFHTTARCNPLFTVNQQPATQRLRFTATWPLRLRTRQRTHQRCGPYPRCRRCAQSRTTQQIRQPQILRGTGQTLHSTPVRPWFCTNRRCLLVRHKVSRPPHLQWWTLRHVRNDRSTQNDPYSQLCWSPQSRQPAQNYCARQRPRPLYQRAHHWPVVRRRQKTGHHHQRYRSGKNPCHRPRRIRKNITGQHHPVTLSRPATPQPVTVATNNPGQLYLQVGAFTNRDNASQLLNRLVSATQQNVSINRKATNNYNVYRVRIGPLQSEADALKLRSQLSPLGIDSPHIVVE